MAEVSIIIPIYNVEKYIERCLDSVTAQTFQDIECVIVDDCGTDNSMDIVVDFISSYHGSIKFNLLHHSKNSGLSAARNTGIRNASGHYIYFLDSDDSITPDCIETLIGLFHKYPNIDFVQGNILQEKGIISPYGFSNDVPEYIDTKDDISFYLLSKITTSAWNRLIRKSFIIEHSLYFPEGMVHEDMYWIYFIAKYAQAAAFSINGTYTYFINENSILTSVSKEKRIARYISRLKAAWIYLEDLCHHPSNKYQKQYFAINLLSCLPELIALHSVKQWCIFWKEVLSMTLHIVNKTTFTRLLFLLVLLPPLCFCAGNKTLRWRIQNNIVSKL